MIKAADAEPDARGERLELLAVVRGLEALDQPSRVTLITPSRYVKRGINYGLPEWGRNGWKWEHFGEMVPVKNQDLWQRLDRALKIHRIQGAAWRVDEAHLGESTVSASEAATTSSAGSGLQGPAAVRLWARRLWADLRMAAAERFERAWLTCAQFGTSLLPYPWLK